MAGPCRAPGEDGFLRGHPSRRPVSWRPQPPAIPKADLAVADRAGQRLERPPKASILHMAHDRSDRGEQVWNPTALRPDPEEGRDPITFDQRGIVQPIPDIPPQRRALQAFVGAVQTDHLAAAGFHAKEVFQGPKVHTAEGTVPIEGGPGEQHHPPMPLDEIRPGGLEGLEQPGRIVDRNEGVPIEQEEDLMRGLRDPRGQRRRCVPDLHPDDFRGTGSDDRFAFIPAVIEDADELIRPPRLTVDCIEDPSEDGCLVMDGEDGGNAHAQEMVDRSTWRSGPIVWRIPRAIGSSFMARIGSEHTTTISPKWSMYRV